MYDETYVGIVSRSNKCIVAQIAANVGGNDLPVDAITRHEVFILPGLIARVGRLRPCALSAVIWSPVHLENVKRLEGSPYAGVSIYPLQGVKGMGIEARRCTEGENQMDGVTTG